MNDNTSRRITITTVIIATIIALSVIVPMIMLRGKYIFTIHDGLDSYAGSVQIIHERGNFFHLNRGQSFDGGINNHYSIMPYELYNVFNCFLGYINGQIVTRIVAVGVGFASMQLLLYKIFPKRDPYQNVLLVLLSMAYSVTPCAPNRQIAFATLPLFVWLFLYLKNKKHLDVTSLLLSIFLPFLSSMASFLVFVLPIWFLASCYIIIKRHRISLSLLSSFIAMCISTVAVNWNLIWISLIANDTNRSLFSDAITPKTTYDDFRRVLLEGQYHSTPLHGYIILPFLAMSSIYIISKCIDGVESFKQNKTEILVLSFGWGYWIISAVLNLIRFSTGITLIDGFGWARCITVMRFVWYIMMAAVIFYIPEDRKSNTKRSKEVLAIGFFLSIIVLARLFDYTYPTYIDDMRLKQLLTVLRIGVLLLLSIVLFFTDNCKLMYLSVYLILILQCGYMFVAKTTYNDTGASVYAWYTGEKDDTTINMNEFFSEELFDRIKADIHYDYDDTWVVAYGFHPSVLEYNGFNTLDRYESLHSMRDQIEFREIIAPALDMYPDYASYYDTWGGRMYLYGEIGYSPTRSKCSIDDMHPLFIDTNALKKYCGKYVLSRVAISNADDLGLDFVRDYDSENSIYHIYLYKVI